MFKRFLINRFNKKYAGKELYFCSKIFEDIAFFPSSVNKCCHATRIPYYPPVMPSILAKNFNFFKYFQTIEKYMETNQDNNALCKGCRFLTKQFVPEFPIRQNIKFITINHFTKCNSDCVYCALGNKSQNEKYKMLPIIKQMIKNNLIHENCLFNWGGGEPVICDEFPSLCDFLYKNNYQQAINSSGIEFSEIIFQGLKNHSMTIQISPDSGTEETYKRIKRQNNFNRVWENIKKYAQYPDSLYVKYIFFSYSANENDVRKFIEKCIASNVKNIVIDCESNSANNPNSKFGNITEEVIRLAILMKNLAIEHNLNYEISYQWKDSDRDRILNNSI